MKPGMIFLCLLAVFSVSMYGQNSDKLPGYVEIMKPSSPAEVQDAHWLDAYTGQLRILLDNKKISEAAYRASSSFCQKIELPENPVVAAFLVYDLITETDFLLRSGVSTVEVKVKMKSVWENQIKENQVLLKAGDKPEKIKKDRLKKDKKEKTPPQDKEKSPKNK